MLSRVLLLLHELEEEIPDVLTALELENNVTKKWIKLTGLKVSPK